MSSVFYLFLFLISSPLKRSLLLLKVVANDKQGGSGGGQMIDIGFGPGGDSHHAIGVIPMLGHPLYTCEYRLGARPWQGFVDILSL
jgi:hypothetical protein